MKKLFIIFLLTLSTAHAQPPLYYLCGSDEDGCMEGREEYCACIPVAPNPEQIYCLDFDKMTCTLFRQGSYCELTLPSQGQCLATLFQSEPEPLCRLVDQSFCKFEMDPRLRGDDSHLFNVI